MHTHTHAHTHTHTHTCTAAAQLVILFFFILSAIVMSCPCCICCGLIGKEGAIKGELNKIRYMIKVRPANLKHQKILRFTVKQQLIHTRKMNLYVYILLEETKKTLSLTEKS